MCTHASAGVPDRPKTIPSLMQRFLCHRLSVTSEGHAATLSAACCLLVSPNMRMSALFNTNWRSSTLTLQICTNCSNKFEKQIISSAELSVAASSGHDPPPIAPLSNDAHGPSSNPPGVISHGLGQKPSSIGTENIRPTTVLSLVSR
jgi:hypothetical protein